jgi:hypothetical protein
MIRSRLRALITAMFVAGGLLTTAAPAAAAALDGSERVAQEPFTAGQPLVPANCATNVGGACFDLAGDESRATILIEDAIVPSVRGRYDVLDAQGNVLTYGIFCNTAVVSIEAGATSIRVSTGQTSADCTPPAGTVTGGTITTTYRIGGPDEDVRNDGRCVGVDAPPTTLLEDDGRWVDYDVYVLVDGLTLARAQEVFTKAQESYDPVKVRLRPEFHPVTLPAYTDGSGVAIRDMATFGDRVRQDFGLVPEGFDIVHILTTKELSGNGVVLCIGGVASKDYGFGVSEELAGKVPMITGNPPNPVPYWPYGDATGRVIAHELGHQLGGQHNLSNCVEGDRSTDPPSPCTLMDGSLGMAKNFTIANAKVVRAHALAYAALNDHENAEPVVPEAPWSAVLLLAGGGVLTLVLRRGRRRATTTA